MTTIKTLKNILFIVLCVLLQACVYEQQANVEVAMMGSEEEKADSLMHVLEHNLESSYQEMETFANYGEDFQLLVASTEATWRGVSLGMPLSQITETETATLLRNAPGMLEYKLELSDGQPAYLHYQFSPQDKLTAAQARFNPPDQEKYVALTNDLTDFFTRRYGNARKNAQNDQFWVVDKTHQFLLRQTANAQGFEVTIELK